MTDQKLDMTTPHHELPAEVRTEVETRLKQLSDKFQRDINTPHPDNPNVPLLMPDLAVHRDQIRLVKQSIFDKWNDNSGTNPEGRR
jgi:hypothetical protein